MREIAKKCVVNLTVHAVLDYRFLIRRDAGLLRQLCLSKSALLMKKCTKRGSGDMRSARGSS